MEAPTVWSWDNEGDDDEGNDSNKVRRFTVFMGDRSYLFFLDAKFVSQSTLYEGGLDDVFGGQWTVFRHVDRLFQEGGPREGAPQTGVVLQEAVEQTQTHLEGTCVFRISVLDRVCLCVDWLFFGLLDGSFFWRNASLEARFGEVKGIFHVAASTVGEFSLVLSGSPCGPLLHLFYELYI